MSRSEVLGWLMEEDPARLEALWARADAVRRQHVGDAVHLRGLIEISNHCVRRCAYCGLRGPNVNVDRYRMAPEAIVEAARQAQRLGFGTVVLQAGEDPMLTARHVSRIVRMIKQQTNLAVTLSLGERAAGDLLAWRQAGADRYLLRFETSDRELYDRIHPPFGRRRSDRVAILRSMRRMGYEIGSGVMVGLPGQTYASLLNDLGLFRALDLDMIGIGPFIAHPETPLGQRTALPGCELRVASCEHGAYEQLDQVPNNELMVYKMVALTRILCPQANIPATTALATINPANGRELALQRGANVVMPNMTPSRYRAMYEIYPNKACVAENAEACNGCLRGRIASIGRTVATGPGGRGGLSEGSGFGVQDLRSAGSVESAHSQLTTRNSQLPSRLTHESAASHGEPAPRLVAVETGGVT
jgi:biotin synthase